MFIKKLLPLLLLSSAYSLLNAQVRINEYSAANWKQFYDNHNDHEDWIELYNGGTAPVNISGYWLSDDPAEVKKFEFPAGTILAAKSFMLVWCSGRNKVEGQDVHTNFRLTQTRNTPEIIVLSNPSGSVSDKIELNKTAVHQSRCRTTDGATSWAICVEPSPGESNNGTEQYTRFVDRPDMDKAAGFYTNEISVAIDTDEPNGVIRYTLDGTEPTQQSPIYAQPIKITQTTVLKSRVFSPDPKVLPSFVRYNTYFINEKFSFPVFSIAADSLIDLAEGNKEIRPIGSIEFFGTDQLRKNASYGELNSHGQDSWVNDQRSLDWISRDEMGYSRAIGEKLFASSERDSYQRLIFRAAGDDNYPATDEPHHDGSCHLRDDYVQTLAQRGGLALDVRSSERCIVFLNGKYWGVYSIRENPDDHDYTEFRYGQGKYDIQYLLTWGDTWAKYGGQKAHDDWNGLRRFILGNDMSKPENYQKVKDSIDVISMIDYFLVNLNVVASDWLNYNTGWWRGLNPQGGHKKWGYILWDLDATFDYYINYSGVPNTQYNADPCDLEQISDYVENDFFEGLDIDTCITVGVPPDTFTYCLKPDGKHQLIILKLIRENPEFRQLYYSRQSDLTNTVFSCENMTKLFDEMVAVLEPEMQRHIKRWGGSINEWQSNTNKMRDFIQLRCKYFNDGMTNCYSELSGPHVVTLIVEPPGSGEIKFNTLDLKQFPNVGQYFEGMDHFMSAKATGNLTFNRWISKSGSSIFPNAQNAAVTLNITGNDTIVAVFGPVSSSWQADNGVRLSVSPTLVHDRINVSFNLPEAMPVNIRLLDALGRQVAQWQPDGQLGQSSLNLDISNNHAPGVYFLEFMAGGQRSTTRLILTSPK